MDDVRSELVIPLLVKDRCIGVIDLESPELDAFTKSHVEVMTLLASQAAVAIDNARLYETIRSNEERLEKELRFAQRVQAALLPSELPKRMKGVDVAARFAPARELGGDLYDFLSPEANTLVVAVGDVSGKGVPAALYGAFAGELDPLPHVPAAVRAAQLRPGHRALVDQHDPPRAPARGVLLHALLRRLRPQAPHGRDVELRAAVPHPLLGRRVRADRDRRRAARRLRRLALRRDHLPAPRGRPVRLLHRRRVRGDERGRRRIRNGAA